MGATFAGTQFPCVPPRTRAESTTTARAAGRRQAALGHLPMGGVRDGCAPFQARSSCLKPFRRRAKCLRGAHTCMIAPSAPAASCCARAQRLNTPSSASCRRAGQVATSWSAAAARSRISTWSRLTGGSTRRGDQRGVVDAQGTEDRGRGELSGHGGHAAAPRRACAWMTSPSSAWTGRTMRLPPLGPTKLACKITMPAAWWRPWASSTMSSRVASSTSSRSVVASRTRALMLARRGVDGQGRPPDRQQRRLLNH